MAISLGDLLQQNGGQWVDLFAIDATGLGGALTRFHAGTNGLAQPVVWQGNSYNPFPIQMAGFEWNGRQPIRPKMSIANVNGLISALVRDHDDLIGAKVYRYRTMVKYLDAVNFTGGNPTADPTSYLPTEMFFVTQKTQETRDVIEFELGMPIDLQGVMLPRRQIVANVCSWIYKSDGCGYAGGPVADEFDNPTSNPALDKCSKKLSGCKLRFSSNLPFGGFPGSGLL